MAKGDGVARMEIDQNSSASDQITNPKFSTNVLQLLKSAQMHHGLRFSDYARYRRYCTARLRRLYKSLKFTHGRGKYTKRAISSSTVTEVRYLHLVLYTAERAWSHAMEKKTLPDGPNARQRSYLIGRLRKAVKWATQFQELCAIKGDSRTSLEAEAYASYMKGSLLFEKDEHWDIALKCFKSARAVYEELGKYGDLENQVLCRERVEELEPSIRYCLHKVGESNLQTSELVQIGEMEGPALDLFKAKLEAVMAEARSQQAASLTEFHWLGHRFPISNAKTRVAILKAQELEKDINGPGADSVPAEKKLAIFDKIFAAYSEARSCIRNDLANTGNSESIKDDLSGLDKAIGAVLGERTIERNQLLVHIAKNKLSKVRDDKNEKVTKPEELVRLYDLLLQNAADLSDLVSSGRDRKSEEVALSEECELKSLVFRAERCFYLAKSYSLAGKREEAYALFCRARTLVDDALKKLQSSTNADQVAIKELKTLYNDCRSNICIEHATGVMEEEKAPENLSKKISSISLTGNDKKAARQLEFFRGRNKSGPTTDSLADAMAIAQHHDAVTGTEKQHVANDYAKRLSIGYEESKDVVAASLGCLTQSSSSSECKTPVTNFKQCPLLNISYCPATEVDLSVGKKLAVLVYNPLGWKRTSVVRIPVINENLSVSDSTGKLILSQLLPIVNASVSTRKFYASAYTGESPSLVPKYWLAFEAVVLPLGFSTYVISSSQSSASTKLVPETFRMGQNDSIEVGPGDLKLIYSGKDGKLAQYSNGRNSANIDVEQSYSYYVGATDELQASGAYVFRPNGTYTIQSEEKIPLRVFKGPLYDEVHQTFSPWVYQITRVYKDKEHAEIEFTVGPIPIDDGKGKEIVTQIKTNIGNNKTFYTDSNGRDFLERIRDYRADWNLEVNQPIAGNYYPINLGIYMKDESTEMSVLVDRSVGGSSITDGEVEIMLHRRLLKDDGRGVDEALNETVCALDTCTGLKVQGKYYLRFDPLGEGSKWRRSFGQEIYSPFLLAFSEQEDKWTNFPTPTFSAMDSSYSLPDNVAILTLQELEDGEVLLRLAHLYEVGEDKDLSSLANVELKRVFPNRKINKIKEMSLSANQEREEMERKRLSWKVEGSNTKSSSDSRGGPIDPSKLVVELAPMEVRTFIIDFNSNLLKY